MSGCNFELISSYVDIIIKIYKHLAFGDQLRLSRVNGYFKSIFETYIWKEKYQTLKLFERTNDEFVVSNETDVNRLCLNLEELQEYLKSYGANVRHFTITNTVLGYADLALGHTIVNQQLDMRQFQNLHSISYVAMKIPKDHLKLVAELYPNLQELQLIKCQLGEDINAVIEDIVSQFKNLKLLCCTDLIRYKITYDQFYGIVSKIPMESLILNALIEPDQNAIGPDNSIHTNRVNLRELRIRTWFDPDRWSNNYSRYLQNFESLVCLKLEIAGKVTDKPLATIAETCKNLETFSIRYTIFQDVQLFLLPPKVSSFSLCWCKGLSHTNLRQLLSLYKIKEFNSGQTSYEGPFEKFQISPFVESLDIDSVMTEDFQFAYENNEHLKELTWYLKSFSDDIITVQSLANCPNLQILATQHCHLSIETLLQLQALEKLTIPHPVPCLSWSYITELLKHPTLKELCIEAVCSRGSGSMNVDAPTEGVATNLITMEIPLDIMGVAVGFWLDVFRRNKDLKRIRCIFYLSEPCAETIMKVINFPNFPQALKTINFCGLTINSNDFRKNVDVNMKKLMDYSDAFRYAYCDKMAFISFERPNSNQTVGNVFED